MAVEGGIGGFFSKSDCHLRRVLGWLAERRAGRSFGWTVTGGRDGLAATVG